MINVMMITRITINTREVLLMHGSTITVPEFNRNAEDGMVAPTGIDCCNSFVIGLKTYLDMIVAVCDVAFA
jgi:hypothetical protein